METVYEEAALRVSGRLGRPRPGKYQCWCCPTCLEAKRLRKLQNQTAFQLSSESHSEEMEASSSSRMDFGYNHEDERNDKAKANGTNGKKVEVAKNGDCAQINNGYGNHANGHNEKNYREENELSCVGTAHNYDDDDEDKDESFSTSPRPQDLDPSRGIPSHGTGHTYFQPGYTGHRGRCCASYNNTNGRSQCQNWGNPGGNFGSTGDIESSDEEEGSSDDFEDLYGVRVGLEADPLEHLVEVLRYHPQYLDCFLDTHRYLLYGSGPLSYHYRHYIAIMAAARNRCAYLVEAETALFIMQGGERAWLRGLDHVPRKLRLLSEINNILAHRPWLLQPQHINALVRDTDDKWTLSEVAHAIVLLSHFHALSSFVHGSGITHDDDHVTSLSQSGASTDRHVTSRSRSGSSSGTSPLEGATYTANGEPVEETCLSVEELIEKMRVLSEEQCSLPGDVSDIAARFDTVENLAIDLKASSHRKQRAVREELKRYVDDPNFSYQDFSACRGACLGGCGGKVQTFVVQDYSWEVQGYSLASRLYMEIGGLLDEKFNLAQNLTYYTCGNRSDVDTTLFRQAVWRFVHCLYGMRHDDYDYSLVSRLLDKHLRTYIKAAACHPESVTSSDYNRISADFQQSEKVHINIMIMEARMQSGLLYGLRAVSRQMNQRTC